MESLSQQLSSFTLEEKTTTDLCVILSGCIKSVSSLDVTEHQNLFDICIGLYGKNKSPFVAYLLEKLLVNLPWLNQNLNIDVLWGIEFVRSSCNTNLLKSISRKVKKNELDLSQTNCFRLYLLKMVHSLLSCVNNSLENIHEVIRENTYQILKIFKSHHQNFHIDIDSKDEELMKSLERFYHHIQQWILLNTSETLKTNNLRFVARILKCITQIENLMDTPPTLNDFGYQFINQLIGNFDQSIQLCDFDLCGEPDLNRKLEDLNNSIVVDKNTGRSMLLSFLDMIRMNHTLINQNDLNKVLQTTFSMFEIVGIAAKNDKENDKIYDIYISFLHKLFLDQDDDVIRYLSLLFDLNQETSLVSEITSPNIMFYELCSALLFDDSVLLDWLMNETSATTFTSYLVKLIKLAAREFISFTQDLSQRDAIGAIVISGGVKSGDVVVSSVDNGNILSSTALVDYSSSEEEETGTPCEYYTKSVDDTISCLIRLNLKLERMEANGLLPNSLELLREALDKFEEVYEK